MNLIRFLLSSIGRWRIPYTRNQWIKFLVALSLCNCYLLLAACLTPIFIGALTLDPSDSPTDFIGATAVLALILVYYLFRQTYDCS
jgi:hypothetical protein